jgi:hypothetical protein
MIPSYEWVSAAHSSNKAIVEKLKKLLHNGRFCNGSITQNEFRSDKTEKNTSIFYTLIFFHRGVVKLIS